MSEPQPYQWPYPGPYQGAPYAWQPVRAPWAVRPLPGVRYDRLARTSVHRWWRPVAGTLAIVAAFLVVSIGLGLAAGLLSIVAGLPMAMDGSRIFVDPVADLGFQLGVIALSIPLVLGAAWAIQRRPPGTLSSVAFRLRWAWLGQCLLIAVVAVVLAQSAEAGTLLLSGESPGFSWVGWDRFLPPLIVILLLVPFQAAAEEYAFRGWVIQAFGAYLKSPWPGVLLGAAAFASLHGYTDWGIAYVFGFGVLMGWLAILTGGLEAPIALHVMNNVGAFGITAAAGDIGSALHQGALPWQSITGTVVQFAVFGFAVVIIARKRAIQTLSR
ncbi:CPBP family intramembrane metalloprotease [Planotetraspora phitsanulokensis]|uniref:CAAX amino protease n=1 Tax=Planotetraspora phitsanulokensis TaxID=575192 RepID=A0A8J3U3K7_9ACTN|nr:type II CAAX endopeptidase family protein [Planotetraspora phitsanulokensis]GII37337.1 CAAX amino protease [Planotetraspora phitsanulokensis]